MKTLQEECEARLFGCGMHGDLVEVDAYGRKWFCTEAAALEWVLTQQKAKYSCADKKKVIDSVRRVCYNKQVKKEIDYGN